MNDELSRLKKAYLETLNDCEKLCDEVIRLHNRFKKRVKTKTYDGKYRKKRTVYKYTIVA